MIQENLRKEKKTISERATQTSSKNKTDISMVINQHVIAADSEVASGSRTNAQRKLRFLGGRP